MIDSVEFGDDEIGRISTGALLYVHGLGKFIPHAVLPCQIVFFHALVVVAFSALAYSLSTSFGQCIVNLFGDNVVVLVGPVSEAEDDVFESIGKGVLAIGEGELFFAEVLDELDGVIGRFAFSVCSDDKEYGAVLRELIQVLVVVVFSVTDEGPEAKLGLGLFGETNSVILGGTSLRAVEDGNALFLRAPMGPSR